MHYMQYTPAVMMGHPFDAETPIVNLHVRPATIDDAPCILAFIRELADYEKALDEVTASLADIEHSLFDEQATARALICECDGRPIGYAVYFFSYSTWQGRNGLSLEDLYVSTDHRGLGAGKLLLKHLARQAWSNDCGRLEWSVLDWNTPAIDFYRSIGAQPQSEWVRYRMEGDVLRRFADA
ncbi:MULTISPECIES: GNAT family N-acetyltransferase [unclassified Modicisalibacter]|uniref:GNAT family N-acetyltransferase n=1 Tax=unclassified Modicisalibacter TaxID=2679913 RepID=UPI0031BB1C8F